LYNDAFSASMGPEKHPAMLGARGREMWAEVWSLVGAQIEGVMAGQGAVYHEDQLVPIYRHGKLDEVYWTYSYSPIDHDNGIGGVLVLCTETTAQVRRAHERQAQHERQQQLFEQAPGFIIVMRGPQHVVEFVNDAHRTVFNSHDWVGKPIRAAFPSIAGQGFFQQLDKVYATGETFQAHGAAVRYRRSTQSAEEERYLDFIYAPWIDADGRITGIFCEGFDVTDARHAQQRLRESEARFRFLYQLTEATKEAGDAESIMAITTRLLGQHLDVSVCAYADMEPDEDLFTIRGDWSASGSPSIVGTYSLASFGKKAVKNLRAGLPLITHDTLQELGPEDAALFLQLGLQATICLPLMKQGRLTALMAIHSARPRVWTREELALLSEVKERSWAHIQRVRSEAETRLGQQRFRGAVDAVQGTLWTNDAQGRMKGEQTAWAVLTGQSYEEYQDYGWANAVHPDDAQPSIDAWSAAVRECKIFEFEHRVKRAFDGAWRRYAVRAIPLLDKDGQVVEWVGVHTDVTEQRAAEEALREADRRKDEFIATLAHELRNPLAPIRNASLVAKSPGATEEQRRWSHDVIERQVKQMALLLDDLLDVSRITRGILQLRREPVALAAIVDTAVETSRPLIDARGHELSVALPKEPLWLQADPLRLAQVLSNLLTNAAKYSEPGGKIELSAERGPTHFLIRVKDSGLGIEPQFLPRIFEMFSQGQPAIDRAEGGLGIGLALVRGLVTLHGGTLEATSPGAGQGSLFTVRLPLAVLLRSPHDADRAEQRVGARSNGRRVLVVDDNRDSAESLALLLSLKGHEIRCAHDGQEALELADAFLPELVLLDIGMPHMNGYEVAKRIRAQSWGRDATLVAITGWGQAEDKRRASEAGFDHHLVKPIDSQELTKLVG
jgi:PAS domain S-box-containing protein